MFRQRNDTYYNVFIHFLKIFAKSRTKLKDTINYIYSSSTSHFESI